jgi:hypothetical protein
LKQVVHCFLARLLFTPTGIMCRGENQRNKGLSIASFAAEVDGFRSASIVDDSSSRNGSSCCTALKLDQDTVLLTLRDKPCKLGQRLHEVSLLFQNEF